MTDTPDTQTEPENPDAETETPIEGDDADAEVEDAEQTPQQAATSEGSDELLKRADKENQRYHKALARILGEDSNRHECPACNGLGIVWGEPEAEVPMVHPDNLVSCETCNGYGQIITGSRNPDHALALCIDCAGNGYKTVAVTQPNVYQFEQAPITAQQAQMGTMLPDGTFVPFGTGTNPQTNAYNPA